MRAIGNSRIAVARIAGFYCTNSFQKTTKFNFMLNRRFPNLTFKMLVIKTNSNIHCYEKVNILASVGFLSTFLDKK